MSLRPWQTQKPPPGACWARGIPSPAPRRNRMLHKPSYRCEVTTVRPLAYAAPSHTVGCATRVHRAGPSRSTRGGYGPWILLAAAALLLCLAAAPSGAKPVEAVAEFSATSMQAVGPDPGHLSGRLSGLLVEDTGLLPSQTPAPVPPFKVFAQSLIVAEDASDAGLHLGVTSVRSPWSTTTQQFSNATIEQVAHRAGYKVDVLSPPGATPPQVVVSDGCFRIGPTDQDTIVRQPIVNGTRPSTHARLDLSALASPCGAAQVEVSGTFQLHLWQTDALVRQGDQQRLLRSGNLAMLEGGEEQGVSAGRDQEYYILVRDGKLILPFAPNVRLYLEAMAADLDGELVFEHAFGLLRLPERDIPFEDQTLRLRGGAMDAQVVGRGQEPLQFSIGPWQEAKVEGLAYGAEAPASRDASALPAFVTMLAALALARRVRAL